MSGGQGREHGDRHAFLAGARHRLATSPTPNRVHPLDPQATGSAAAPAPGHTNLGPGPHDRDRLVQVFARSLEEAGGTCHLLEDGVPDALLDRLVTESGARHAVVSAEPEARAIAARLAVRDVDIRPAAPAAAAAATLGITSATAGVAATGSVVLSSIHTGGRVVSVLPPVHLCVLPAERIVATPGDVLRPLDRDPAGIPPSLVLVTGPSRSGDIEQILTIGAHGPAQLHVLVTR